MKVNESKSAVARPEERKFLGFRITNDGSERQIAPKALERFKTRVRELTRRTLGVSLPKLVEKLAPYLVSVGKVAFSVTDLDFCGINGPFSRVVLA